MSPIDAATLVVNVKTLGVDRAQRDLRGLHGSLAATDRRAGKTSAALAGLAKAAKWGGLALGVGLVVGAKKSIDAFAEAEKVTRQTEAVLKSTGRAAGVTKKQVEALALAISRKTGIDDEAVQAAENLLLTFTKIHSDVFPQATRAVTDMATALNHGAVPSVDQLHTASIQLGKALQDPELGMTALRRVGVNFTKDQKTMVEGWVKHGETLKAQKFILAELTKEFGGSAAAAGGTFSGSMAKARNEVSNLGEIIGKALAPSLASAAQAFAKFVTEMQTGQGAGGRFVASLENMVNWIKQHQAALKGAAVALAGFWATLKVISFARFIGELRGSALALGRLGPIAAIVLGSLVALDNFARRGFLGGLKANLAASQQLFNPLVIALGQLYQRVAPVRNALNTLGNTVSSLPGPVRRLLLGTKTLGSTMATTAASTGGLTSRLQGAQAGVFGLMRGIENLTLNMRSAVTHGTDTLASGIDRLLPKIRELSTAANSVSSLTAGVAAALPQLQAGGVVNFAAGGLVPSMLSPGEMGITPSGHGFMVPGTPTAADSVFMPLPSGTEIFTGSGQAMLAAGASRGQALSQQAPHFRTGGVARGAWASGLTVKGGRANESQRNIADLMLDTAVAAGANNKVRAALMATGIVESELRNVRGGGSDAISWGVLQDTFGGTGPPGRRSNIAANTLLYLRGEPNNPNAAFHDGAIKLERQHPKWSIGQIAQAVQRSAFPERYDQVAGEAWGWVKGHMRGGAGGSAAAPGATPASRTTNRTINPALRDLYAPSIRDSLTQGFAAGMDRGSAFFDYRGLNTDFFGSVLSDAGLGAATSTATTPTRTATTPSTTRATTGKRNVPGGRVWGSRMLMDVSKTWPAAKPPNPRLVSFGRLLQKAGFNPTEHPQFGGVGGNHASYGDPDHFHGGAIDVGGSGATGSRIARLAQAAVRVGMIREWGPGIIWQGPGAVNPGAAGAGTHTDHVHVSAHRRGGKVGGFRGGGTVGFRAGGTVRKAAVRKPAPKPKPPTPSWRRAMTLVGQIQASSTTQKGKGLLRALGYAVQSPTTNMGTLTGLAKQARQEILRLSKRKLVGREITVVNNLKDVLSLLEAEVGRRIAAPLAASDTMQEGISRAEGNIDSQLILEGIDPQSAAGIERKNALTSQSIGQLQGARPGLQASLSRARTSKNPALIKAAQDELNQVDDQILALQASLKANTDAVTDNTEQLAEQMKALADLVGQQVTNQQRIIALTTTQGPGLMAALAAVLSGDIGGRVGLGFQTPGYAGQGARY